MVVCYLYILFFFFKQKTAYEMRISDWSSDVCSSDLVVHREVKFELLARHFDVEGQRGVEIEGARDMIVIDRAVGDGRRRTARGAFDEAVVIDPARNAAPRQVEIEAVGRPIGLDAIQLLDRKRTRLNSSH